MSSQRHTVTKLTIELHLASRDEAWDLQNEVSATYQRLVLEELERIFDAMLEPNEVVTVNRLEIDAGEIEKLDELPQALKTSAEQAIRQLLHEARQSPNGNAEVRVTGENGEQLVTEVQIRHRVTTDTARLAHFLRYGVLPPGTANESVREITQRLLENEPEALRTLLQQQASFHRLAEQFSEDIILKMLRVFRDDAEMLITLNFELIALLPAVPAKRWWEAAFRFKGELKKHAALVLQELSPLQKQEVREQLLSGGENETLKAELLEALGENETPVEQIHDRLQQAASVLSEKLEAVLQKIFSDTDDALAVTANSFADFFNAGKTKPAEFRRLLEQLRNAARILIAEPEGTAQAQKMGTRMTLQRLSAALAEILSEKIAFTHDAAPGGYADERYALSVAEEMAALVRQLENTNGAIDKIRNENRAAEGKLTGQELNTKKAAEAELVAQKAAREELIARKATQEELIAKKTAEQELAAKKSSEEQMLQLRKEEEQALHDELKRLETLAREALEEAMRDEKEEDALPPEAAEGIYIRNAGLVLFGPFLRQFFEELGLVEEDAFVGEEEQHRAVHLLHYLATGWNEEVEEPELVLNKLLCGVDLWEVVPLFIPLSDAEKEECEELLQAVIRNWEALKRTSPSGLQANFILREGKLQLGGEGDWDLQVERTTSDLLIDSLPYSIDTIRLPWMETTLYTEW